MFPTIPSILRRLIILGLWGIAVTGAPAGTAAARDPGPNVILIVSESLRADHMGAYGYGRDTTDSLDGLAAGSMLFENAYAPAPCTNPAMADILVSRYQAAMPLPDGYVTMAEFFRDLGYRTAAVVEKNPFLEPGRWNLGQGFDLYDYNGRRQPAPSATDRAAAWLERKGDGPFFLWVFYYAPHWPYAPPGDFRGHYAKEELLSRDIRDLLTSNVKDSRTWRPVEPGERKFLVDAYDEEVRYMDHEAGRLLSYLKERGLFDSSLIVFTADHGEELGEGGLWDHCNTLSPEELRVPLLVKLPGGTEGMRIEAPVQTIDIFPTLAEIIGGDSSPPPHFQGRSLRPLAEGRADGARHAAAFWKDEEAVVAGGYRYWRRGDEEMLLDARSGAKIDDAGIAGAHRGLRDELRRRYLIEDRTYDETLRTIRSMGYFE